MKHNRRSFKQEWWFATLIFTGMLLISTSLFAQSDNSTTDTAPTDQQDSQANKPNAQRTRNNQNNNQSKDQASPKSNTDSSDRVFKPTEEISADVPVNFPVDI